MGRGSERKRRWLICCSLLALTALSVAAQETAAPSWTETTAATTAIASEGPDSVHAAEASRAYRQALATLSAIAPNPAPVRELPPQTAPISSFIARYLQTYSGPLSPVLRFVSRLRQPSWLPQPIARRLGREEAARGRREDDGKRKAIKVLDLLQHSADLGHDDALFTLAQLSLFPPTEYFPHDPALAFETFAHHLERTGNATSQAYLAFFYSTGYHDVTPADQAKAQLYYTFAAHGGDRGAQQTLGYRFWAGIGTLQDCSRAMEWYEAAAEQSYANFLSGPPGGLTLPLTSTRLSDLVGGVYGPGASVASTGLNAARPAIKAGNARTAGETSEDVLEYYLFNADRGDVEFAYRLGKIFYQGSMYPSPGGIASGSEGVGAVPRDYQRARYYFLRIARQVWPRDPPDPRKPHLGLSKEKDDTAHNAPVGYASAAAGYLGRIFLRGEGVKPDPALARLWFERGAEHGDRECHLGLGLIWRDGLVDGKKDIAKSTAHFQIAAGQDLAEAQVQLGKYHRSRGEPKSAHAMFEAAVRIGAPFEAFYYLAESQAFQARHPQASESLATASCAMAVSFFKLVAERGVWGDDLLREAEVAWAQGSDRDKEIAMLKWWMAAERGSEIAQNNLAYLLDQDKSVLRLTRFAPITPSNNTARLALTQWTRSAAQNNIDALVKVGDYYYHGLGVADEPESVRYEKAAGYYRSAADTQVSALAMWNLGWMYENGLGVPLDFHLAKRYYDLALETNNEAYLPITLSLVKLYAKSFWHTVRGGQDGLSFWPYDDEDEGYQYNDGREIEGARDERTSEQSAEHGDTYREDTEDDGTWYSGKAREQYIRRRRAGAIAGRDDDDDPIQWARERRNAEQEREGDFGPDDYFEGAMRERRRHSGESTEESDELTETIVLVLLCLGITALLYWRARYVEGLRQEEQQQNGGAAGAHDGGLFPPPGDPARDDWAILR